MCKTALHDLLTALPKCEHHIHIEGALTPQLLFKFAARNNINLASADPAYASAEALETRYKSFQGLQDFIQFFSTGSSVLVSANDFEDLGYSYFTKAHAQNVKHAEVFFDPQAHTIRGVAYDTVVQGLLLAKHRAERDFDISIEFIPCILRHHGLQSAIAMFQHIQTIGHFNDGTVAGLGMAGDELVQPPEYFQSVYDDARKFGVRSTAHVGQAGPASFVTSAIDNLRVERVDHGWISKQDPQLIRDLAEKKTLVTLCPISNLTLGFVDYIDEVPIREFLDHGVCFSINSDDPAYFGNYIQDNYCAVQEAFNLNASDWYTITMNAVQGSWCSEGRKSELKGQVAETFQTWHSAWC